MAKLSHQHQVVVLDTETTGLSPRNGDRIIEVAAIRLCPDGRQQEYSRLVNPGHPICPRAQAVHGITETHLRDQPPSEDVIPELAQFIADALIVAHNVKFDLDFLRAEYARVGLALSNKSQCTLRLSRRLFADLPDYKLETVYRGLGGPWSGDMRQHRALDDARMTVFIWDAICRVT
jgi:DNA polymerase-3 subunit epsilon